MDWRDYITVDPAICHGQACIKNTRIMASVVLDNLATGMNVDELLNSYPSINRESVLACIHFAAELARERVITVAA